MSGKFIIEHYFEYNVFTLGIKSNKLSKIIKYTINSIEILRSIWSFNSIANKWYGTLKLLKCNLYLAIYNSHVVYSYYPAVNYYFEPFPKH